MKKHLKKLICIFSILAMLSTMVVAPAAFAAGGTGSISLSNTSGEAGANVELQLTFTADVPVYYLDVVLEYDKTNLELIEFSSENLPAFISLAYSVNGTPEIGILVDDWTSPILAANETGTATVVFKIKEGADPDVYAVSFLNFYQYIFIGNYGLAEFNSEDPVATAFTGGTITVGSAANPITIADNITNGSIQTDPTEAAEDAQVTVTVTPDEDYELDTLTYKTEAGEPVDIVANEGIYSFNMPAEAVEVSATFKQITYAITTEAPENGQLAIDGASTAARGDTVTVTVTPNTNYQLKAGTLGYYATGSEPTLIPIEGNSFEMPAYAVTVTGIFELSDEYIAAQDEAQALTEAKSDLTTAIASSTTHTSAYTVSADGVGIPAGTKWITQAALDTYSAKIAAAEADVVADLFYLHGTVAFKGEINFPLEEGRLGEQEDHKQNHHNGVLQKPYKGIGQGKGDVPDSGPDPQLGKEVFNKTQVFIIGKIKKTGDPHIDLG
jgi:hypothetical protein